MSRGQNTRPWIRSIHDWIWGLFLLFTGVGFVVMPLHIGEAEVTRWISNAELRNALLLILSGADATWMFLAAVNVYFWLIRAEGLPTARRWAGSILIATAILEWAGAVTDYPFGPYDYTTRLGWKIGGVLPFTIPLAWFIVVICGRYTWLSLFPKASRIHLAVGTGLIALLTDLNMEMIAWKVRAYWIWYPGASHAPHWPPLQNYISWFVSATLLALCLREDRVAGPRVDLRKPIWILGLINALFGAIHLAVWLGW